MFIVIELQTNNGAVGVLTYKFTELAEAYAKYYTILSAAAVSDIEVHTALIVTETGQVVRSETFAHERGAGNE